MLHFPPTPPSAAVVGMNSTSDDSGLKLPRLPGKGFRVKAWPECRGSAGAKPGGQGGWPHGGH